ncbi:response regulator [Coprobacillus sp. AF21-8LB]|nr:response regulator [Coprobacillus sp. AF21-8LB]
MLKMIICDDDKIFCSSFEDLVIELCRERNLKYEIFMFYETAKLKKFLEDNNDIDLIFLDIELKKTLGYELGNYIRNVLNLQKIDIVYISNNSSYAMALFKTRPIDFLIKPIKKEDLRNVIDQYLKLNKEKKDFFKFKNKIGYQKIDVQDIYYFESENKTAENTLVLSENDDVHIHGEERISTENADGTQTYLSGNNQSVMAEISSKGTMS